MVDAALRAASWAAALCAALVLPYGARPCEPVVQVRGTKRCDATAQSPASQPQSDTSHTTSKVQSQ